jgi:sulfate adenylyltransferase/3'-phosphoadenosine 5'-phosphosulfate synthase
MAGFVVWFTGLSGAGKSTLAALLAAELRHRGVHVEVLDGDEVRTHLSKGLGFSREDRDVNVRRIGFVAKLLARAGACAITAAISPYRAVREEQRAQIAGFVEVFVRCSVPVLAERDAKGLYKKALAGEIKHFTGIDDPYEEPLQPEVVVDTAMESKEESLARIVARLEELGHVPRLGAAGKRAARALPAPHGGELVDRFGAAPVDVAGWPAIDLDERAERDLEMIATGAFSPLKGFMGPKDYLRVVREMRLENGLVWPLPITLAVAAERADLAAGRRAALRARDGRVVGLIDVEERWTPDKEMEARLVFGTTDAAHPGVAALRAGGEVYLGGEVTVWDRPLPPLAARLDPKALRALLTERGMARVAGLHVRGPMLRAHEHLVRAALEGCDGLVVHPPEVDPSAPLALRLACHEALVERRLARERVIVAAYPGAPRWAGAREAVLHLLARKNHGLAAFVVGPTHAAAPGFAEAAAAHRIFDGFAPGELGADPLPFEEAFWSRAVGGTATHKTAPAGDRVAMARAELEAMLARGETPPEEIIRPEVARLLIAAST